MVTQTPAGGRYVVHAENTVPSESHNNEHQSCRIVDDPNLKNVDNKAQEFTDVMKVRDVRSKTSAAT